MPTYSQAGILNVLDPEFGMYLDLQGAPPGIKSRLATQRKQQLWDNAGKARCIRSTSMSDAKCWEFSEAKSAVILDRQLQSL